MEQREKTQRRPEFPSQGPQKQTIVFPAGSAGKESTCKAGDTCLIPGSGRSPGGGNGNPFQYSCLDNPMDRGAWQAI